MSADFAHDPVAVAVAAAVTAAGRSGLPLDGVWDTAHAADPELAWAPGRRARLAAVLDALAAAGVVRWSGAKPAFDRTGAPPLPRRVRTTAITAIAARARPIVPAEWRPELEAIHRLSAPRADELAVLHAVNDWLRDRPAHLDVIPLRERSWEIFRNEKRLDGMLATRLFREGVLSLELLSAVAVHPPFVHRRLAENGDVLICENHQTYHSAHAVLAAGDRRGFAIVGYGAGNQFPSAVSYVEDLGVGGDVVYFGDFDADGLRIAAAASTHAAALGVCKVVPATGLYRLLLNSPVTAKTRPVRAPAATALAAWLDEPDRPRAIELLTSGQRVPQEAVTAAAMCQLAQWR